MKADYWHKKWQANQIAFHESEGNAMLVRHLSQLELSTGARIFVPLCGKTRDIGWLRGQGFNVVGAELSEIAVQQLFAEMNIVPDVADHGVLKLYRSDGIEIYVGDIFELTADLAGSIDAIFDRAAMVALPDTMRGRYTQHMIELTNRAPQLLITFSYDHDEMPGPPFSIPEAGVRGHYANAYDITCLETTNVEGKLKGQVVADEIAWHLTGRGAA